MDMYSVVKENPILAILRNIPLEYTVDYAQAIVDPCRHDPCHWGRCARCRNPGKLEPDLSAV